MTMPHQLPLPADLQHLIEKRSGEERREKLASQAETVVIPTVNDVTSDTESADLTPRVKQRRKR